MVGNGEEILGGSGLDATDIRKLKEELENQQKENEWMRTELTKKDNEMKELQTQLGMVKMEAQVQAKQL